MKGEVFVDSGAFVAYLVGSDRLHRETVALFSQPPRRWCTSILVVAEAYGWFLHRVGEDGARMFRLLIEELPELRVLPTDTRHIDAVWRKLDALRGSKLTFVDASSLVFLESLGIATVWGTDHDLGVEGAKIIPGSPAR